MSHLGTPHPYIAELLVAVALGPITILVLNVMIPRASRFIVKDHAWETSDWLSNPMGFPYGVSDLIGVGWLVILGTSPVFIAAILYSGFCLGLDCVADTSNFNLAFLYVSSLLASTAFLTRWRD